MPDFVFENQAKPALDSDRGMVWR